MALLKLKITKNEKVTKHLEKLLNGLSIDRQRLHKQIAEKIASDLRKKFRSNRGESWWKEAAGSVEAIGTGEKAQVIAAQRGVALHRYGGTVLPDRAKCLAIPLRAEFRRISPRRLKQIKPLFKMKSRRSVGRAFLAYKEGDAIRIAYLLTSKVVIKPHPESFLTDEQIINSARTVVGIYLNKSYGLSI